MGLREDLPAGVVTLVFTDIEGSTRLLHDLGDVYAEVLADQRRLLRTAFAHEGGVEVDTQGDAFFFAFPDAGRALAAVAQGQRVLASHVWPGGHDLRVRMGVHTGEPLRTPEGYVGVALHQGARVMACAHGQQVVVSAAAASAGAGQLGGTLSLQDLGEHRLKDLSEPQRLFQLCGDGLRDDFPPLRSLGGYFTNLPTAPGALYGRRRELAELVEALAERRLVTLTGPGGTGKTRLALQVGAEALDRFPGGVFFCDLAPLSDPALVAATIAQALGLREQPGRSDETTVAEHVGERALLLVLDNFEQLLAAAPVVSRLLAACPSLRVLTTSRAPLRVAGEREFPLESLALPDAVELFEERVSQLGRDAPERAAARATVEAICERLDSLPLALELAAARMRSLTAEQLLARLEQRLSVLGSGWRDAPARQRTLRATLDWSYELLSPAEQMLLARLGVFVGGCTLEAAEQVAGADIETVEALIEQSLLRHSGGRYRMLESVREYALDLLERAGELEAARARHADWALELLAAADMRDGEDFPVAASSALAEGEVPNLRQALPFLIERRPDEVAAHSLAVVMIWLQAELWREGLDLVGAIGARASDRAPAVAARLAAALSMGHNLVGDMDAACACVDRGIALAERAGDESALAMCIHVRTVIAGARREPGMHEWASRLEAVVRSDRARGHSHNLARNLINLAAATTDFDRATSHLEEAVALARMSDPGLADMSAYNLASLALQARRYEAAEPRLIRMLRDGVPSATTRAYVVRGLGVALAGRRANREAARLIGSGDAFMQQAKVQEDATETEPRDEALVRIEAEIGAGELKRALREGSGLRLDDAVELALSLAQPEPTGDDGA
jgi:predicted ATPase/class 3 adenylate cyclase